MIAVNTETFHFFFPRDFYFKHTPFTNLVLPDASTKLPVEKTDVSLTSKERREMFKNPDVTLAN